MLRNKDLFEHVCTECGRVFLSDKEKARKCPSCQEAVRRKVEMRKANKYCVICGTNYTSMSNNSKYCPNCRKKITKKPYISKPKRKSLLKTKSLDEIILELEEYNKKNGTQLTYGKYVSMLNF